MLLEKGAFGNGCFCKWLDWKMVIWKRVLLEKDDLEKDALGKGCFWKWVLLEMDELENGLLEKVLLEKNAFGKKERMGELKSSKKEKK